MIETYIVPGEDVYPEGITEHPDGETFFVSGSKHGTIYRGQFDSAELEVWQPAGSDGREQALGMAIDARGRLLVCGYKTGGVFAYDTVSGEFVNAQWVPTSEPMLNDISIAGDYAYVTDSARPVLWRFPLTDDGIGPAEEWMDLGDDGYYLNGIVTLHDGATLLVAAQGTEVLWRIDIATREAVKLDAHVAADGMLVLGDLLYTVDNEELPDDQVDFYLTTWRIEDGARRVTQISRRTLSTDDTPTTVAFLQNRLLVVNAQFIPGREGRAKAPFTVSAITP